MFVNVIALCMEIENENYDDEIDLALVFFYVIVASYSELSWIFVTFYNINTPYTLPSR